MGESIFEGAITKWLKQAGDRVEKDEPLFEISTDKVDAEIPAPVAGFLTEIRVPVGTTVDVNTVVAVISDAAGIAPPTVIGEPALYQGTTSAVPLTQSLRDRSLPTSEKLDKELEASGHDFSRAVDATKQTRALAPEIAASLSGRKLRSSPLVRRIAKENNLDLNRIAGSGSEGRITKEDILRYLNQNSPGTSAPQAQLALPQVALSKMRAIIAQRMVESVRTSPHVHTVYKIDMTRIARLRERERTGFEQRYGVKLTYMPFIAAAAVEALKKFPIANASLIDGFIHYHPNINLGIAVALEWGLIVPVVRAAEGLSFPVLARTIADLAERARTKKLLPEEVQGGTFTLTNSGVFGGEFGTPILNQPEAAILAIGGLRKEPVVLTDAEGNDAIAIRSMQHFCLGFDHRLIDGAEAGKFMSEIKRTLESWERPLV
jgi:2-oxoglutarate dehydrogenase E2 component (dihydrolipoamide succinyltransferase)